MKLVQAYLKPHKVSEVSTTLHRVQGVSGITVIAVEGWGRGKRVAERSDPGEQARDFEVHAKLEVVCEDGVVPEVTRTIHAAAHTGLAGDGLIYVCGVERTIHIGQEPGSGDTC